MPEPSEPARISRTDVEHVAGLARLALSEAEVEDRKSTRLNSSHT